MLKMAGGGGACDPDVPDAPITFVSRASEDKQRFVRPLATKLRGIGVDAWLDEWEIAGADSPVDRTSSVARSTRLCAQWKAAHPAVAEQQIPD
jgi:hypothetical protein